jgi:hypothetical protein
MDPNISEGFQRRPEKMDPTDYEIGSISNGYGSTLNL